MFRIEIFDRWPGFRIDGGPANYGRITFGDGLTDYETFIAPTYYKSARWYRRQWDTALRRFLGGAPSSSLIVSARDPMLGFIEKWDLWNTGTPVAVMQNSLVVPPHADAASRSTEFNLDAAWEFLESRPAESSDDEAPVSQWQVPLVDIDEFMREGGPLTSTPSRRVWPAGSRHVKSQPKRPRN